MLSNETPTKRAILYARVSSDDTKNDNLNLKSQMDMCREFANKKGYDIIAELAESDRGASGASINLPQLDKVRTLAQQRKFDVLIVREIDRLSRSLAKQLIIEKELHTAGVDIEYVIGEYPNTPEGQFMKHIRATVAEYEREKIKERMERGKRNKIKSGNVMIARYAPYGYRKVNKNKKYNLEIHPDESKIVTLIFDWYVNEQISMYAIAQKLNDMGVPYPQTIKRKESGWLPNTIGYIIKNETYAGTWHFGKKNPRTGETHPKETWIAVEVPAIIDRTVWEAAQEQRAKNKSPRQRAKHKYLLSGHVTCGDCGHTMSGRATSDGKGHRYLYYICPIRNGNKNIVPVECHNLHYRVDRVDFIIWNWLKELLSDPENLQQGLEEYKKKQQELQKPLQTRLNITQNLIADNQKALNRLLDLYLSEEFEKELLIERKKNLEITLNGLRKEERELLSYLRKQTLTAQQIQGIKDFAAKIQSGLMATDDDFETRRKIIELLDVQVTLTAENGEKTAYVQCKLSTQPTLLHLRIILWGM